jgi:hypothetical protein
MNNKSARLRIAVCVLLFFSGVLAHADRIPAMANIPEGIGSKQLATLNRQTQALENELQLFQAAAAAFNAKSADKQTDREFNELQAQRSAYVQSVQTFNEQIKAIRIIQSINAMAKRLDWGAQKRSRLDVALNRLQGDGDSIATSADIRQAWQEILTRGENGTLAREASEGDGPKIVWSGRQSHEDCAVFALASAVGLPYSVAATRATELIKQAEWHSAEERANPQQLIESRGLNGGEVIMLAEVFGRSEVVQSSDFAKTLRSGRPVMINVVPPDGDTFSGHEIVLSKTFQHGGEIWFEMLDSNHDHPLYLNVKGLNTILQERGVAFRSEPGATPKPLRDDDKHK